MSLVICTDELGIRRRVQRSANSPDPEVACTTVDLAKVVCATGSFRMVDGPVAERGVLTAPDGLWDAAVRQAEVIGPLAEKDTVGLADADEAAAMLQVSRRQVYVLVGRWRAGEGVVSDGGGLLPRPGARGAGPHPGGGLGGDGRSGLAGDGDGDGDGDQ
ncbi:helix-turn-helix domain-containing protein [Streptomyces caniscabiei]|uniref:helix-turn-helix domain-containing protein n=1 Tax=Streptomyces caniscabiei TaxID=2746961 RepID=UPI0029A166B9|nr:helix-turn-helix domain-containing protein [Streptomyces caniscabiei]MDX3726608.1 helix-turn-helix domain-containing protein [Streptomyces caniscabiei]